MNGKTKAILMSHKILEYGEDLKKNSEALKYRKRRLKDKGEIMLIDCELEVIRGLIDKTCEMMDDINEHLDFKY